MTAQLHSLPTLPVQVDDDTLPAVRVITDADTWDVHVEVTRQVDLPALFDAINQSFILKESMRRLMFNQKNASIRRDALTNLLQDTAVRAALTITLDGGHAETLGILLDDASREPFERCGWYDLGASCSNFVTIAGAELCGEHQAEQDAEIPSLEPVRPCD